VRVASAKNAPPVPPPATFNVNCGTFTGAANVNQQPGYRFQVTACDVAEPGAGKDTFRIDLTGPGGFSYSRQGTISEGNVQIQKQQDIMRLCGAG